MGTLKWPLVYQLLMPVSLRRILLRIQLFVEIFLNRKYKHHAEQFLRPYNRPGGYKTFFVLNSTEHEISSAHKN